MGITKKDEWNTERFNRLLHDTIANFKVHEWMVVKDVNEKLGEKETPDGIIGSHPKRTRNDNWDFLHKLLNDKNYTATNTFFEHKARNFTTWEN